MSRGVQLFVLDVKMKQPLHDAGDVPHFQIILGRDRQDPRPQKKRKIIKSCGSWDLIVKKWEIGKLKDRLNYELSVVSFALFPWSPKPDNILNNQDCQ